MMPAGHENYQDRLRDALIGLVPLAFLERTLRCADPNRPTRAELHPTDAERDACLEKLVMADGLACGQPTRSTGALAATAKALAMLCAAPGGVNFLGHCWSLEDVTDAQGSYVRLTDRIASTTEP